MVCFTPRNLGKFIFIFEQNHEWIRRWESEDVDVADWVTKTMDLPPSTPNRNVSPN